LPLAKPAAELDKRRKSESFCAAFFIGG